MGKYIRICSGCGKKLEYKYPSGLVRAEKRGEQCGSCAQVGRKIKYKDVEKIMGKYIRTCSVCHKKIEYEYPSLLKRAEEYDAKCGSCGRSKKNTYMTKTQNKEIDKMLDYLWFDTSTLESKLIPITTKWEKDCKMRRDDFTFIKELYQFSKGEKNV